MKLRPQQQTVADYTGGRMAVSAVPGSGKTQALAALVASLIGRGALTGEGEILVVTFTNSAVDNVKARIRRLLTEANLPADAGYRVLTLHGLANTILRDRPDLAGTGSDYRIDDELSGEQSMPEAARWFIQQERSYWESFLPPDLPQAKQFEIEEKWRERTITVAREVTKLAKNLRLTPEQVAELIRDAQVPVSPFLRIGAAIYERYDTILKSGGRLDFDDLIWRAIQALDNDPVFRARLGAKWQFVLEDEAQDSTPLQEEILGRISREHGNWVRVGDPNQAIMTTFTASDVRYFREFAARADVTAVPLPVSGRSAPKIIALANRLADWVVREHPADEIRRMALDNKIAILPTDPGDAQPNPPDAQARIALRAHDDAEAEVAKTAQGAANFVLTDSTKTCALLTPTNDLGKKLVDALTSIQAKHPDRVLFQDQLKNPQAVRDVAKLLAKALKFCAAPVSMTALAELRDVLGTSALPDAKRASRMRTLIRSAKPERLLFPDDPDEPALPEKAEVTPQEQAALNDLASHAAKWLRASTLPIDQLLLTIAQDTLTADNDLAVAHSLAVSMRRYMSVTPSAQLGDLAIQLEEIASNKQRYLSNALIESGFEPMPGVITVTTLHKAKGLEWDRVYLISVDQSEFPHDPDVDFRGQVWYLGKHDPAVEARKQLEALAAGVIITDDAKGLVRLAHLEYIAERLRLLYVGITRAKSELSISYAKKRGNRDSAPALAISRAMAEDGR